MVQQSIKNIINKVYPTIAKDYSCNAKVEIYYNIYERLSGVKGMTGSVCAQAEYNWNCNEIYLYVFTQIKVKNYLILITSLV